LRLNPVRNEIFFLISGFINFKEFVCGLSVTTRGTPDEKLMWTFNVYDVNHDGTITRDEMSEIMRASIYHATVR